MKLGHWVTGSPGHHFDPVWDPSFFRFFSKKCPKCKTYIWNAEMTKVIVYCLLLDWNHWMLVHAMNFHFYLWLLKTLWPENTSSHIHRHLEFIIEQGHRVNWVSGSLDSRVAGSQNVTQFHFCDNFCFYFSKLVQSVSCLLFHFVCFVMHFTVHAAFVHVKLTMIALYYMPVSDCLFVN